MAKCDEGYLCQVCGKEVSRIVDSSLYLQYVIGWIDFQQLQHQPDIHLQCNPNLAQFIESECFPPQFADGPFDRRLLDPHFAAQRTQLVTRGYLRLRQLQSNRETVLSEYPLDLSEQQNQLDGGD